jgi:hypothetical protein
MDRHNPLWDGALWLDFLCVFIAWPGAWVCGFTSTLSVKPPLIIGLFRTACFAYRRALGWQSPLYHTRAYN